MARNSLSKQNTRSAKNPFNLGSFGELTLRYLTGSLGPKNKVISGGYGEGEYNHWYSITLTRPGWIVVIKGGTRPKYITASAYDLNRNPIQGRGIFDADSVAVNDAVEKYYPYLDTVMGAQSDLYNTYERLRLDKGDERYYPLEKGTYLICVSSTRNETLDYGVGIVVEFPVTEVFIELEDGDGSLMLSETEITGDTLELVSPINTDIVIPDGVNAFTETLCEIEAADTVTVPEGSTWLIGERIPLSANIYKIICEPGSDLYFETIHDHSLSEWRNAWNTTHKTDNEPFPAEFLPYVNRT
jgi:hypothetical protein